MPEGRPPLLRALIKDMLNVSPKERPTIQQVCLFEMCSKLLTKCHMPCYATVLFEKLRLTAADFSSCEHSVVHPH